MYKFLLILIFVISVNTNLLSEDNFEKGLRIAKESYESTRGYVDSESDQLMILVDPKGNEVIREISGKTLENDDPNDGDKSIIFFNKPKIVLLDEPLAALDPLVIQDIQKYILKIQSSGTAILVTDHNVKNLFDITDRSYVLGENTVIAEGTSRELLKSSKAIEHYFGSQFS